MIFFFPAPSVSEGTSKVEVDRAAMSLSPSCAGLEGPRKKSVRSDVLVRRLRPGASVDMVVVERVHCGRIKGMDNRLSAMKTTTEEFERRNGCVGGYNTPSGLPGSPRLP